MAHNSYWRPKPALLLPGIRRTRLDQGAQLSVIQHSGRKETGGALVGFGTLGVLVIASILLR